MLQCSAHVPEIGRGSEEVPVGGQHVLRGRLERGADHHVDARDRVVVRARDDLLGQRADAGGGGVMDDQERGHTPIQPGHPTNLLP